MLIEVDSLIGLKPDSQISNKLEVNRNWPDLSAKTLLTDIIYLFITIP